MQKKIITSETQQPMKISQKCMYAMGEFTITTVMMTISMIYASYYLIQVAGLRPALAGLVLVIGRTVDAVSDPLMGRISDQTRWRLGRRRPYFLIGTLPFALTFMLLWFDPPLTSQIARFSYFTTVYCAFSVSLSVLSVPYIALLPEMVRSYDERTSLNTFRMAISALGVFAAVAIRPISDHFGGGSSGFFIAGMLFSATLAPVWLLVYWGTFEPKERPNANQTDWGSSLLRLLKHRNFVRLSLIFVMTRAAVELSAAMLILYFGYWLRHNELFETAMLLFLVSAIVAYSIGGHVAKKVEKSNLFMVGALWWIAINISMAFMRPEYPAWIFLAMIPLSAAGIALVDVMPWSMLGDVIDEGELITGTRSDGVYAGLFNLFRKLGGSLGVFIALTILDGVGFSEGSEQSVLAIQTIRWLTALGPLCFLAIAIGLARNYPLTRQRHGQLSKQLNSRPRELDLAPQAAA